MDAQAVTTAREETLVLLMSERNDTHSDRWARAYARVNDAADALHRDLNSVLVRVGLMRGRITERTSCPIDITRLRAFRLTAEAGELPKDKFGRIRTNAKTLGEITRDFLIEVTGDGDGKDGMETTSDIGRIEIEYRYSLVGEALMITHRCNLAIRHRDRRLFP